MQEEKGDDSLEEKERKKSSMEGIKNLTDCLPGELL